MCLHIWFTIMVFCVGRVGNIENQQISPQILPNAYHYNCGKSRELLSQQQAELYTKLADLNRELRQVRKQIKMCEEIRVQAAAMQENIQNIEHSEREVTKHHDKQR